VTRTSFLDLNENIVQVEFSGAGALTLTLDDATAAAAAQLQPAGRELRESHARLVIAGADETTNVSVFAVGRFTAVNQGIFADRPRARRRHHRSIAISSANGKFGGVRTANCSYAGISASSAFTRPG